MANAKDAGKKAGKFFQEFKEFAMRGNVIDMAVGVVIGGAFGQIVTSLVNDIIMPLIGAISGGLDFTTLRWVIRAGYTTEAGKEIAEASLNYGNFIQVFVNFIIIAFSIFLVIKLINSFHRKKEEPAPAPEPAAPAPKPAQEVLLEEIRDLLKEQNKK
ncbi:MAG: large-conductance mechanosensitive channel protein MscL [Bacteroidales bacterium]|nr:large-conductance mechanosensitive channel protein MscL [Bacteroidales bacterium]